MPCGHCNLNPRPAVRHYRSQPSVWLQCLQWFLACGLRYLSPRAALPAVRHYRSSSSACSSPLSIQLQCLQWFPPCGHCNLCPRAAPPAVRHYRSHYHPPGSSSVRNGPCLVASHVGIATSALGLFRVFFVCSAPLSISQPLQPQLEFACAPPHLHTKSRSRLGRWRGTPLPPPTNLAAQPFLAAPSC